MFSPFDLPEGILLLITDELPSSAEFVLHQCLITHLKDEEKKSAHVLRIVISVSEGLHKWQSISAKSNVNLSQHISAGTFHLIDGSMAGDSSDFFVLYERIASMLSKSGAGALVILDDISSLEWIGCSMSDLFRFCRALRVLCLKNQATLLIRHHIVTPAEPDALFRHLYSLCMYHLDVHPLISGRSGAVSGQIALHPGPAQSVNIESRPRNAALQYRLTDGSAVFFERGSSRGV